jgi:2',3'-cyclic-nucleotide 2'-phosphodiesterase
MEELNNNNQNTQNKSKNILFLGDICSDIGREAVIANVKYIREKENISFIVAQGENVAAGFGITPKLADNLFEAGINCITLGDHFLDRKDIVPMLESEPRLLRPANFHNDVPGKGAKIYESNDMKIGIINLLGRVFLKPIVCPFEKAVSEIEQIKKETPVIFIDFHAEATAEKKALGWYLDGRISGLIGTHTHVQTADEQVLPNGTAYITDIGMCGAMDSVLGMRIDLSVKRLLYSIPLRLLPAKDNVHINGVIITVDTVNGKALGIKRLDMKITEPVL